MKDKTPPTPPPGDNRPGAATVIKVSAADLADLIGDAAATNLIAQAALKAVAQGIEAMARDCRAAADDGKAMPPADKLARGLETAREILNAPGLITERAANGMRQLEAAICAAASKTEGKKMTPPGLKILDGLPDDFDGDAPGASARLIETVQGILQKREIGLALAFEPSPPPSPFTGRNGASWPGSRWNPDAPKN